MPSNVIAAFLPSIHGFRFRNDWPPNPARVLTFGPISIPIGDTGRGLCGGMIFAARDRFHRGEAAPPDAVHPAPGTALFREVVDRQFASFGRLFSVPLRFWLAAMPVRSQAARDRATVRDAWPEIRAAIDRAEPPMVGLVRKATWNPLANGLGHQVVAFRYDETATGMRLGVYDPNHPGIDSVELSVERQADGSYRHGQSTGEPLIGLLALPYSKPKG
jgi:hypothetical protein